MSSHCRLSPKSAHQKPWIGLKMSNGELARKIVFVSSRHRVIAARGERMATRDASRPHPTTLQPAVAFDRLVGVVGAGRVITARRRHNPGERQLITADQQEK